MFEFVIYLILKPLCALSSSMRFSNSQPPTPSLFQYEVFQFSAPYTLFVSVWGFPILNLLHPTCSSMRFSRTIYDQCWRESAALKVMFIFMRSCIFSFGCCGQEVGGCQRGSFYFSLENASRNKASSGKNLDEVKRRIIFSFTSLLTSPI